MFDSPRFERKEGRWPNADYISFEFLNAKVDAIVGGSPGTYQGHLGEALPINIEQAINRKRFWERSQRKNMTSPT